MKILMEFQHVSLTDVVTGIELTRRGLQPDTRVQNGRKRPPKTSDPPNPELITLNPQRKFYGLTR